MDKNGEKTSQLEDADYQDNLKSLSLSISLSSFLSLPPPLFLSLDIFISFFISVAHFFSAFPSLYLSFEI